MSVDLPTNIDSKAVTFFYEKDSDENLLELNAQDMKLCKLNACSVIPETFWPKVKQLFPIRSCFSR